MKEWNGSTHTALYYHEDHINSSNVITDSSGNQAALIEYDPYGSTVTHTGSANPKHKFTGQEEDTSAKLYYYNARYYDPQLGRFITADTIVPNGSKPQEFNRYTYANNNPVKFTDPSGHKGFWKALISVVVGAVVTVATGGCVACGIMAGSITQGAMTGGVKGALLGALAASGAFFGSGIITSAIFMGATTGLSSQVGGGSFVQGFTGGAVSGALAGAAPFNFGSSGIGIFSTEIANDFARGFATGMASSSVGKQSLRSSLKESLYQGLFSAASGQVTNVVGHVYGFAASGGSKPQVRDGRFYYSAKGGGGAVALGNTITYDASLRSSEGNSNWLDDYVYLDGNKQDYTYRDHELGHYNQGRALGVGYIPTNALSLSASAMIGAIRDSRLDTHRYNPMERTFNKKPAY